MPKLPLKWGFNHIINLLVEYIANKLLWGGVFMSGAVAEAGVGYGGGFALLVVLFILLIIVGAAFVGGGY